MNILKLLCCIVFVFLAGISAASAADSTSLSGRDVSSQDSIPAGFVAVWPTDAAIPKGWLPCDGQAVPADCPILRGIMSHVPSYNTQRQFLRGASNGAGTRVSDSVRSHAHQVDQHSHTVSGAASSQTYQAPAAGGGGYAVSAGGMYSYRCAYTLDGHDDSTLYYESVDSDQPPVYRRGVLVPPSSVCFDSRSTYVRTNVSASGGASVAARTSGGSITGITDQGGAASTHATGDAETAPAHTLVKYIIKAH